MSRHLYADVILPLAVPNLYTYGIPPEMREEVKPGCRVIVQFGKKKLYSAIIRNLHDEVPSYPAKNILSLLDTIPLVNKKQFRLWDWMMSYYMCTPGEVMIAALPSGYKLQSETRINLNQRSLANPELLNAQEYAVLDKLSKKESLSADEVAEIIDRKNALPVMSSLLDKGFVFIEENIVRKYRPKMADYVRLSETASDEKWMSRIFSEAEKRAPKQLQLLMTFFKLKSEEDGSEIAKSELLKQADCSASVLSELVKKKVFVIEEKEIGRLAETKETTRDKSGLSDFQQAAMDEVKAHFEDKDVVLLHGVTSSGKTEIYIHLIEETLKQGKQALYLLPEIALTTQIINRLRKIFGNKVGVYHSKFNDSERVEIWKNVNEFPSPESPTDADFRVILGARSAIFLPFSNLGLIIVDEEHDHSYKQYDPAPRYNARDCATILASVHGAKTLIGSATPSIESYFNAVDECKYGLVTLTQRYGGIQLPEVILADIKEEKRRKINKSHFSSVLFNQVKDALDQKEQVILFQNRRGFAPFLECELCAWTPHCIHCDVSLTYHKQLNQLRCHYCGYSQNPPSACSACGHTAMKTVGFGTERIEDDLSILFPEAVTARMDLDTTRSKFAHEKIISEFEKRRIDILVGTQMVTKGLDFDNVTTVGIMNADNMLNFPDFRAFERAYQMFAQVSGRSGRKSKRGKVIIQTHDMKHIILKEVLNNDFRGMYDREIEERKKFKYPPFYRLIQITLKHKDVHLLGEAAAHFAAEMKMALGKRVLGPEMPVVGRIRNLFLKNLMIKIEKEASVAEAKDRISVIITEFKSHAQYRPVQIHIDVDPL